MDALRFSLLGSPRVEYLGEAIDVNTNKTLALLIYIAYTGRSHKRDHLANLLWPDGEQAGRRALLRNSIYSLRKALPDGYLKLESDLVALDSEAAVWIDIRHFESLLAECDSHVHGDSPVCADCLPLLADAADLCRDGFLEGFALRGSTNFDDWQQTEAHLLFLKVESVFMRLVRGLRDGGAYGEAAVRARQWLSLDPTNEAIHRELIGLYGKMGQRVAAIRQYRECTKVLQDEIGQPPGEDTVRLYDEIVAAGTSKQSDRPAKHNIPSQISDFIGRKDELFEVSRLLSSNRLLTIVGAGGCGKTRLAVEAAHTLVKEYADGVWYVELAPLTDPEKVLFAVMSALSIVARKDITPLSVIQNSLRHKEALIILDNCEHLIGACADLTLSLLQTCPKLKILTTSRESLGVSGEVTWVIPPLPFPDINRLPATKRLGSFDAVKLFVSRAASQRPEFTLDDGNARSIAGLCSRLDGIPLAIEIAAAKVKTMTPNQIADKLNGYFRLLHGNSRGSLPRHRSLFAAIDWSYQLLTPTERLLIRGLSVFQGGWTLEAAIKIFSSDTVREPRVTIDAYEVVSLTEQLLNKSMIQVIVVRGASRYNMLEMVRQFCAQIPEGNKERIEIQNRHMALYRDLAQRSESQVYFGPHQTETLLDLDDERDNLRSAIEWALSTGQAESALRIITSLWWYWFVRDGFLEERDFLIRAIDSVPDPPTALIVKANYALSMVHWILGDDIAAESCGRKSLEDAKRIGDEASQGYALIMLGQAYHSRNEYQKSREFWKESLALFRRIGDKWGTVNALRLNGVIGPDVGEDLDICDAILREGIDLAWEIEDRFSINVLLHDLGRIAKLRGNYSKAIQLAQESIVVALEFGQAFGAGQSHQLIGSAYRKLRAFSKSSIHYAKALRIFYPMGLEEGSAECLVAIARNAIDENLLVEAVTFYGSAQRFRDIYSDGHLITCSELQSAITDRDPRTNDADFFRAWDEGRSMHVEQIVDYAFQLFGEPVTEM